MAPPERFFLWLNEECVGPFTYQEVLDQYLKRLGGNVRSSTLYSPNDGSGLWEPLEKLFKTKEKAWPPGFRKSKLV